jgi:hypothetical protein
MMREPVQSESSDDFTYRANDHLRKPTYDKLRIEYSKHALGGLLAKHGAFSPDEAARQAFEYADAMVRRAKLYDDFYQRNGIRE